MKICYYVISFSTSMMGKSPVVYSGYLPSLSVARQGLSRRAITHWLKPYLSIAQETLPPQSS